MAKVVEAENRMFHNVFVCRVCKTKIKAPILKVTNGKVKCRKCGSTALRPKRKR